MKLPNYKRLYKNDFSKESQELIDQLANSLNIGIESLYDALDRKVSLTDNIASTVKDVRVIVDATGNPTSKTGFSLDLSTAVLGLQVIRAENLTNTSIYPSGGIFITYTQNNQNIIISNVTGLQANNDYRLKVIAWHS